MKNKIEFTKSDKFPAEYTYKLVHTTKHSFQYQCNTTVSDRSFLTDRLKIESFQNYSNGKGFTYYLRTRGENSWKKGELISGLYKTCHSNTYYGDYRNWGKSLILIQFKEDWSRMLVKVYKDHVPILSNKFRLELNSLKDRWE